MISERQFIRQFSHLWKLWLPNLNQSLLNDFTKNKFYEQYVYQWSPPIISEEPAYYNDLISEIAFSFFAKYVERKDFFSNNEFEPSISEAITRIQILRKSSNLKRQNLSDNQINEAKEIALRLVHYFSKSQNLIQINEQLPGYGILNSCYPDIIQADELIEVKMSKDSFKIEDIRQILTYTCLAYLNNIAINKISLLNPRLGLTWCFPIDELCLILSDQSSVELFSNISDSIINAEFY